MGVVYREGGTIGSSRGSSASAANGIWSLHEVEARSRLGIWPEQIVKANMVLHYDAAVPESYPGTGTAVTDLSASNIAGTLTDGASYATDNGGTFTFDGVNDRIANGYDGPNSLMADANGAWSVEVWFNFIAPSTASTGYMLVNRGGGRGAANTFSLGLAGTAGWSGVVRTANSLCANLRGASTQITAGSLSDAGWHQAVLTWDLTTARAYLNGVLQGTVAVGTAAVQVSAVTIGALAGGGDPYRNHISNVKIYSAALSATEVARNFNALRGRYGI